MLQLWRGEDGVVYSPADSHPFPPSYTGSTEALSPAGDFFFFGRPRCLGAAWQLQLNRLSDHRVWQCGQALLIRPCRRRAPPAALERLRFNCTPPLYYSTCTLKASKRAPGRPRTGNRFMRFTILPPPLRLPYRRRSLFHVNLHMDSGWTPRLGISIILAQRAPRSLGVVRHRSGGGGGSSSSESNSCWVHHWLPPPSRPADAMLFWCCRRDSGRSVWTPSVSLPADWLSYTRASGSPRCCQVTARLKQKLRCRDDLRTPSTFGVVTCRQRVAVTKLSGVLCGTCLSVTPIIDNSVVKTARAPVFELFNNVCGLFFMV